MTTKRPPARPTTPVTTFSFVGNLGCIRFPVPIRKASGIKRGDRLTMTVEGDGVIVLERLQVSVETLRDVLSVDGCACQNPPAACGGGRGVPDVLTVGWSYVRLSDARATELGVLPEAPLRLVAEPGKITVALHPDPRDLEGVPRTACPP
jgi:bifunctional DNA-binding transcriptional regulator/antitoxin component of YhaV-PrlF toxin-antitoxin module